MCSCSDNDVDAIHSDVTWTSLLTVRLFQQDGDTFERPREVSINCEIGV